MNVGVGKFSLPRMLRPNPRMQPTGRGGPGLRSGAALLKAKQWRRQFGAGAGMIACS
jgi:hypothetical protein